MLRLIGILVVVAYVLFTIEILKSNKDNETKALWIVVGFFIPVIGIVLYYLVGRKRA